MADDFQAEFPDVGDQLCALKSCGYHGPHTYYFPAEPLLKEKWVEFVRDKDADYDIPITSVLCFKHFATDQFINHSQWSFQEDQDNFRLELRKDAMPTFEAVVHPTYKIEAPASGDLADVVTNDTKNIATPNIGNTVAAGSADGIMDDLTNGVTDIPLSVETCDQTDGMADISLSVETFEQTDGMADIPLSVETSDQTNDVTDIPLSVELFQKNDGMADKLSLGEMPHQTNHYTKPAFSSEALTDLFPSGSTTFRLNDGDDRLSKLAPTLQEMCMYDNESISSADLTDELILWLKLISTPSSDQHRQHKARFLNRIFNLIYKHHDLLILDEAQENTTTEALDQEVKREGNADTPELSISCVSTVADESFPNLQRASSHPNSSPPFCSAEQSISINIKPEVIDPEYDQSWDTSVLQDSPEFHISSVASLDRTGELSELSLRSLDDDDDGSSNEIHPPKLVNMVAKGIKRKRGRPPKAKPDNSNSSITGRSISCPDCSFTTQFPNSLFIDHIRVHGQSTRQRLDIFPSDFICKNCGKAIGCTHAVKKLCAAASICGDTKFCCCLEPNYTGLSKVHRANDSHRNLQLSNVDDQPSSRKSKKLPKLMTRHINKNYQKRADVSTEPNKEYLKATVDFFEIADESLSYQCYFCEFASPEPEEINMHITSCHIESCKYSCKVCKDFSAKRKANWLSHMTNVHQICTHIMESRQPRDTLFCIQREMLKAKRKKLDKDDDDNLEYLYAGLSIAKDPNLRLCNSCEGKMKLRQSRKKRKSSVPSLNVSSGGVKGSREGDGSDESDEDLESTSSSQSSDSELEDSDEDTGEHSSYQDKNDADYVIEYSGGESGSADEDERIPLSDLVLASKPTSTASTITNQPSTNIQKQPPVKSVLICPSNITDQSPTKRVKLDPIKICDQARAKNMGLFSPSTVGSTTLTGYSVKPLVSVQNNTPVSTHSMNLSTPGQRSAQQPRTIKNLDVPTMSLPFQKSGQSVVFVKSEGKQWIGYPVVSSASLNSNTLSKDTAITALPKPRMVITTVAPSMASSTTTTVPASPKFLVNSIIPEFTDSNNSSIQAKQRNINIVNVTRLVADQSRPTTVKSQLANARKQILIIKPPVATASPQFTMPSSLTNGLKQPVIIKVVNPSTAADTRQVWPPSTSQPLTLSSTTAGTNVRPSLGATSTILLQSRPTVNLPKK